MYIDIIVKVIGAFAMWLYKGCKTEILTEYENYGEKHRIAGFIASIIFITVLIFLLLKL